MRPISLSLQGIRSFKNKQIIDFEWLTQNRLFGIFGNTGSGKSTILSSIIIALYGKIDDGNAEQKDFISLGQDSAEIEFEFEIKNIKYRVVRSYKVRPSGINSKAVLVQRDELGNYLTIADMTKTVNEKVEEIIGLSITEFRKCVVLPQGEFASFLNATPADRLVIIGKLFDLEQYGEVLYYKISERVKELNQKLIAINSAINAIGEFDYIEIEQSIENEIRLNTELENLNNELKLLDKLIQEQKQTKEDLDTLNLAKSKMQRIDAKTDEFVLKQNLKEKHERAEKVSDHIDELTSEKTNLSQRQKDFQYAEGLYNKTFSEFQTKKDNLAKLIEENKKNAAAALVKLSKLNALSPRYDELKIREQDLINLKEEYKKASDSIKACEALKDDLLTKQKDAIIKLQKTTMDREILDKIKEWLEKNAFLDGRLDEANYAGNFLKDKNSEFSCHFQTRAKEIVLSKNELAENSGEFDREKYNNLKKLEEELNFKQQKFGIEIEKITGKIELEKQKGESIIAQGQDIKKNIEQIRKELALNNADFNTFEEFKAELILTDKIKDFAEKESLMCDQALKELENNLTSAKNKMDSTFAVYESSKTAFQIKEQNCFKYLSEAGFLSLEDAKSALLTKKEYNFLCQEIEEYKNSKLVLKEQITSLNKKIEAVEFSMDLFNQNTQQKTFGDVKVLDLTRNIALEKQKINDLKIRRQRLEDSKIQKSQITAQYDNAKELEGLVKGKKLMEYVAEEFLQDITNGANHHIARLSGGRYILNYKSEGFFVTDNYSGGILRKVSTLSGGETFLISLSLAVALSEAIAKRSDKAIEFFFLDEGFGTLDKDLCDTVIQSLENLKDSHFTIGLISHVPELVRRMEYKIMVSPPNEEKGSVISVSGF